MKTKTTTIEQLKAKWIGRKIFGSTEHRLLGAKPSRVITDVHYNEKFEKYVAFSGEHHTANSVEALDRRLESLAR